MYWDCYKKNRLSLTNEALNELTHKAPHNNHHYNEFVTVGRLLQDKGDSKRIISCGLKS